MFSQNIYTLKQIKENILNFREQIECLFTGSGELQGLAQFSKFQ